MSGAVSSCHTPRHRNTPPPNTPEERLEVRVPTLFLDVYFSRGTLPQKDGKRALLRVAHRFPKNKHGPKHPPYLKLLRGKGVGVPKFHTPKWTTCKHKWNARGRHPPSANPIIGGEPKQKVCYTSAFSHIYGCKNKTEHGKEAA